MSVLTPLLLPLLSSATSAQVTDQLPPAFNSIRTPASPAFALFDLSASAVERPNTPADFAIALLNKASAGETVPQNFAVEVSPYWIFSSHPRLQWRTDDNRSMGASLLRTATVSVGTGEIGTESDRTTALAVGVRASLFSGRLTKGTTEAIENIEKALRDESALLLRLIREPLAELARQLKEKEISKDTYDRERQLLIDATLKGGAFNESAAVAALKAAMEKFAVNREGFFLDIASAAGWSYPNAIWKQGDFDRWAAWVTPSYQTASWSATGVVRFTNRNPQNSNGAVDIGARGTWSADRYAFSAEFVGRIYRKSDLSSRRRMAGIVEYLLREGTWLTVSIGGDHSFSTESSLLARIGLSFNFSRERVVLQP